MTCCIQLIDLLLQTDKDFVDDLYQRYLATTL
jgi:hypothetical protein